MIELTSKLTVEPVQQMGTDEMLVRAMLVSSGKDSTPDAVEGRLRFLMRRRHGTPFEHGSLTVRVHAPIKVFREWHRHRVGWSYNEESARYKELAPVFYVPPPERPLIKSPDFKPSAPEFVQAAEVDYGRMVWLLRTGYEDMYTKYKLMLEYGIDPGLARDVLGVGIYSSMYATANPRSIMHFLELRTKCDDAKRPSRPLWEIARCAEQLEALFERYWPITYRLWNEFGRMAP